MKVIDLKTFESGEYAISTNQYTEQDLIKYIDKYETNYLEDLLGVELSKLFLNDLDANKVPQTPRFQVIYNKISIDYGCEILRSEGIPAILSAFIWCEYVKDQSVKNSIAGSVKTQQDASEVVSFRNAQFLDRFNQTVRSFHAVQIYINENASDYPEFNGTYKHFKTII